MGIEVFSGIWSFNTANPVSASDAVKFGANHLRGIKSAILYTFPNVTGVVTASHSDFNSIPNLAPKESPTFTGTPVAPNPPSGDNTTRLATTAWVYSQFGSSSISLRILDKGRLGFYGEY
jgi:hypothetical protein